MGGSPRQPRVELWEGCHPGPDLVTLAAVRVRVTTVALQERQRRHTLRMSLGGCLPLVCDRSCARCQGGARINIDSFQIRSCKMAQARAPRVPQLNSRPWNGCTGYPERWTPSH
jgi:hypothetical protein